MRQEPSAHVARDIGFAKKITDTPDFLSHTQSAYISSLHYFLCGANNNQIAWRFFLLLALYFLLAVQHGAGSAFTSAPSQKAQPRSMLPPPTRSVAWWSVALWLASLAMSAHPPSPLAPVRPSGAPRNYSFWRLLADMRSFAFGKNSGCTRCFPSCQIPHPPARPRFGRMVSCSSARFSRQFALPQAPLLPLPPRGAPYNYPFC